jgi:hypothetical protein
LLELSSSSTELLESLKTDLDSSESELRLLRSVSENQALFIEALSRRTGEMAMISTRQSLLLKASSRKNKALVFGLAIGVPAAFALGLLVSR